MSEISESLIPQSQSGELVFEKLTKEFSSNTGLVRAVDEIDLVIKPGEFVTLLGPSGCGKTTTLRMIAGFESPTRGRVLLDRNNMVSTPPNQRPMAMVFQSYALFPHLSVRDNVAYGLKLKKLPKDEVTQEVDLALVSMNLTHLADRAPAQLSGGQQQRVALARAMVMRPKVLLFDEPLSNLDAKLRTHMRLEIRRLQQRLGITSVYVTHDQSEAMSMSDRIVVMNNGQIEQVDTPETIYRHPASVFVADFIGRANFLPVHDAKLIDDQSAEVIAFGERVTVARHPDATSGDLILLVRPESVRVAPASDQNNGEVGGKLGRVLASVFYGESVEYEVETEYGTVVAVVADPRTEDILNEGDLVTVEFNPQRAWLLPDTQEK